MPGEYRERRRRLACGLAIGLCMLAGCGGSGNAADPGPSVSISEPPPTSETPSTAAALGLGDPATPTAAVKASVLDYRPDFPSSVPADIRPAAVLVRMCSTGIQVGEQFDFGPHSWRLRTPGGHDYEAFRPADAPGVVQPALNGERPGAGVCVEGWVYFKVQANTETPEAVLVDGAGDLAVWELRKR